MAIIRRDDSSLLPAIDSLWDSLFNRDFLQGGLELGTSIPAVNTRETEREYLMELAAPGLKKEDFDIGLDHGVLTISSVKKEEKEEKDGERVTRKEFSYSSFKRSFHLPEDVNTEGISAEYRDGILRLNMPKMDVAIPDDHKQIEIK